MCSWDFTCNLPIVLMSGPKARTLRLRLRSRHLTTGTQKTPWSHNDVYIYTVQLPVVPIWHLVLSIWCLNHWTIQLVAVMVGTELKWLVRTFLPHMAAGISLEASVLPALGSAKLWASGRCLAWDGWISLFFLDTWSRWTCCLHFKHELADVIQISATWCLGFGSCLITEVSSVWHRQMNQLASPKL